MNQYGKAALKAVELYKNGDAKDIVQAWNCAIAEFTNSETSQKRRRCQVKSSVLFD